ncbi:tetratricopeptide repeat protein [Polyangium sp. 15x6]|uniref:tetratricopeptide repeat protein n=1 Tax=Polyangium sp. 15x6 TaxID=3042687 RepID=UPI00249A36F2|nr:tetratricopeptide repeat protein [Polyangium sp. 15x6]MDI3287330.1 tetratricopeptide repeat protein [Polyangium sp. 15x6]
MNPLAFLRAFGDSAQPEACLDELDQSPDWPAELGVFLALELPPLGDDACALPSLEGLALRVQQTLRRRFGPEPFEQLWQAASLFDLPNHTFTNQWPTHHFTTSKTTVARRIQAAGVHARALVPALRIEPSLLATFGEVAEVAWVQYKLDTASGLFEILLEALLASDERACRLDIAACHFFLGMIHRATRPEDAENHFHQFLKLAPKRCPDNNWPINPGYIPSMHHRPGSVGAWAELGRISRRRGDVGQARAYFRKAIEIDPRSQEAPYRELGEIHEADFDLRKALREYRKALEVRSTAFIGDPGQWRVLERPYRRELAELCIRMAPHVGHREARDLLQRALALDPDDARRWLTELESIFEDVPQLDRQRQLCTHALGLVADISRDGAAEHGYRAEVDERFRAFFSWRSPRVFSVSGGATPEPSHGIERRGVSAETAPSCSSVR